MPVKYGLFDKPLYNTHFHSGSITETTSFPTNLELIQHPFSQWVYNSCRRLKNIYSLIQHPFSQWVYNLPKSFFLLRQLIQHPFLQWVYNPFPAIYKILQLIQHPFSQWVCSSVCSKRTASGLIQHTLPQQKRKNCLLGQFLFFYVDFCLSGCII